MLNFSFSTVSLSIMFSNIALIFLYFILNNKKLSANLGLKVASIFLTLILVRLLFPFEILPIARNLLWPEKISKYISDFQYYRFFNNTVSLWMIFEFIWILGILFFGVRYLISVRKFNNFIKHHTKLPDKTTPVYQVFRRIQKENPKLAKLQLRTLSSAKVPLIYGFRKKYIIFPDSIHLSEKELYFIFNHEISHFLHHDLLLKFFVQVLCILYWWNPFGILLKKQINALLEMRIDQSLVKTPGEKFEYLECLLKVAKHSTSSASFCTGNVLPFCGLYKSSLDQRFARMLNTNHKPFPAQYLLLSLAVMIFASTYFFTPEAYYIRPEDAENTLTLTSENTFAVKNEDNTYDIYFENTFMEAVSSLEYYPDGLKIYDSLKEALKHEKI